MPASSKPIIELNLLKPQSEPQRILVRSLRWILSSGRFIIVFVEIIVLVSFLARFKLDSDIADTKEKINQQVPLIKDLRSKELLIRQTQFQLTTIKDIGQGSPDYVLILKKIAEQTPQGLIISNIRMERQVGKVELKITGVAQNNNELASLVLGLKGDQTFSGINLQSVGLEQGLINFSVVGSVNIAAVGEKRL